MTKFGFEDLSVWQKAVEFSISVIKAAEQFESDRKHFRLIEQLESCSASIALNIAEGKGRYSKKEFIHFLYIARGSLYETVTLLIIFHKNKWIDDDQLDSFKAHADEIGKMLSSLISSLKQNL